MSISLSRREMLQTAALGSLALLTTGRAEARLLKHKQDGWITGEMTGAQALVETLIAEGTDCVFGIPGAQDNELWDTMKTKGLAYLLATHEYAAAVMADGYARSTGKPGVISIVPGPGVTNALTGIGEALLDSVPMVCIVCDVGCGEHAHAFQVHSLPNAALLQPVTKEVITITDVAEIPNAVRHAFAVACCGEPGPVAVVVPYNFFIELHRFHCPPLAQAGCSIDADACRMAINLLANRKWRIGIYAGLGCMDYSPSLIQVAELLQAPVATSVSGKGVMPDNHPLAVGWGYGPAGTMTAEQVFKDVDLVLALGVRYSEVSTGFYSIPRVPHLIQVDANPNNLGKVVKPDVCVAGDAGAFLSQVIEAQDMLRRPADCKLQCHIRTCKAEDCKRHTTAYRTCGVDPMQLVLALRRCLNHDALFFMDVSLSEHYAAEAFPVFMPRTYFNPTDNQSMGWSIPAAIGAQFACQDRQVVTMTGDGCFLMSAMEISTAGRACLPVKFFVLDDQAYHYMQKLQQQAYRRTTATMLAHLDYAALAKGFGVAYHEIEADCDLDAAVRGALMQDGPVLTRVVADYGARPCRWIDAVRARFTEDLNFQQKMRFASRIGTRAILHQDRND
jgi:acetolactate synthase-1/2/3 large subunit